MEKCGGTEWEMEETGTGVWHWGRLDWPIVRPVAMGREGVQLLHCPMQGWGGGGVGFSEGILGVL